MMMRTRKRRFFLVLLHLLGCQHQLSPDPISNSRVSGGIIGVQPWPMVLEKIRTITDETLPEREAVWIQDQQDENSCLGPNAKFSACGDATLWWIQKTPIHQQPQHKRRRIRMGVFSVDEDQLFKQQQQQQQQQRLPSEEDGLVFYVADRDFDLNSQSDVPLPSSLSDATLDQKNEWWKVWKRRRNSQLDCLVQISDSDFGLGVQTCSAKSNSLWKVDSRDGSLRPHPSRWTMLEDSISSSSNNNNNRGGTKESTPSSPLCLFRDMNGSTAAGLAPCAAPNNEDRRKVQLALVRYRTVSVSSSPTAGSSFLQERTREEKKKFKRRAESPSREAGSSEANHRSEGLPSSKKDLAHMHASEPALHPELKLSSRLLFAPPKDAAAAAANSAESGGRNKKGSPFGILDQSNPILLMNQDRKPSKSVVKPAASKAQAEDLAFSKRRIPVHPYIAASKKEIWTDPQTSLEYPTDLCEYLGHDPKERGRHTLMGVGQYRKGYVIKVYGIAYYVSKRDVLADPFFERFAHLSAEELRQRPEFYDHLRMVPSNFERTLVIKTNMQLSADTIRSSLSADWSMLTDEAKSTLINSSLRPRPANDDMLRLIQNPDNPGKCSCSQVAPEEIGADPSCCARGTELSFTWLKSGDLEVRLNGHTMEVFPRPDIAEGIFFEYLRFDDPISPEFRDRVVEGFPFLLAPLAQVKGVHIGSTTSNKHENDAESENPIFRAAGELADAVSSHAMGFAGAVQDAMSHAAGNAADAARSLGDVAQNFGREANRRRELLVRHSAAFPSTFMKMLSREQDPIQAVTQWVANNMTPSFEAEEKHESKRVSNGRAFGYPLAQWFGEVYYAPDEIGPMLVNPAMDKTRKVFLFLVHLYLLLMFIVSFPGSYRTRTKMMRNTHRDVSSDSDSECSINDIDQDDDERSKKLARRKTPKDAPSLFSPKLFLSRNQECNLGESPPDAIETPLKKKSLSYFL